MKRLALLVVVILSAWSTMAAQVLDASRYEQRTLLWGGGAVQSLDTYLSPLLYRGAHVAILSERFSQMPAPSGRWFAQSLFFLHGDYALAAEGRGLTVGGMADYSYTLFNRLPLGGDNSRWTLCAGAQGQLRVGGIYNLRNSNNPAQLKLGVNMAVSVMGKYAFTLWGVPMNVRLQADLPLLGFAFAPDYGQSYYEIFYLGNDEDCVHVTAPHNNLSLRTALGYDLQLSSCTIRLTWQEDLYHWHLGSQQYRMLTHTLMIGYVDNLYHVLRDDQVSEYIPY